MTRTAKSHSARGAANGYAHETTVRRSIFAEAQWGARAHDTSQTRGRHAARHENAALAKALGWNLRREFGNHWREYRGGPTRVCKKEESR